MATDFPIFVDVPEGTTPEPGTPDVDATYLNGLNGAVNTLENTVDGKVDAGELAAVATSGAYTDLVGAPFVPTTPGDIGAQPAGSYATTTQLDGKAPLEHVHDVGDLTVTGTASATTYLRGDGTWSTPESGGAVDSVNTQTGAVVLGHADVGATRLSVDGAYAATYDLDTTPVAPADLDPPAYSQAETDAAIAAAAGPVIFGTSMWDLGNVETAPRGPGYVNITLGSGVLWLQHFFAPRTSGAINRLVFGTREPAPAGITLARMAIFTVAGDGGITKVAQTASFTPTGTNTDQHQALATAGGFPASYTFQRGTRYAIGLLVVGTTPGAALGFSIPGAGFPPVITRRATGQTDIANTYTNAQLSDYYDAIYLAGYVG